MMQNRCYVDSINKSGDFSMLHVNWPLIGDASGGLISTGKASFVKI